MTKIDNLWWYTLASGEIIGIVKTINEQTGEVKFRIGCAKGINELEDAEYIKDCGARLYLENIK